jgi:hypothetical protein
MSEAMRKPRTVFGLLAAFILGCAATQIAPLVVPPVRAGTTPQKWEYSCKVAHQADEITAMANAFGAQGWELAGSVASYTVAPTWCFKRPLP